LGSRRTVEEWIRAGRVTIGGRVAGLGDRATSADGGVSGWREAQLGGAPGAARELLLYYKPVGEVTTRSDPQRPADRVRAPAATAQPAAGLRSGGWT